MNPAAPRFFSVKGVSPSRSVAYPSNVNLLATSPVVMVRWPDDDGALEQLRLRAVPRLLLVADGEPPPPDADPLQDWIRMPASDTDLHARVRSLELRAGETPGRPVLPGDGRLSYRGAWVVVSPIAERLLSELVANFESVVAVDDLQRAGWPSGDGSAGAFRIHVVRIRQLLEPIGLEVRTVRDRGYVLQPQA